MKLALLGPGKMGTAIYEALKDELEVTLYGRNEKIGAADVFLFAVKPQDFSDGVKDLELSNKLIISIMAGVQLQRLAELTGSQKIVRSMPNLPIQVKKGFTAWIANPEVTPTEKEFVKKIFKSLGFEMELKNEEQLDEITALSGSGPAYFFALCEMLEKKALEWGFPAEQASQIARSTLLGAAALLEENDKTSSEWREAVTSKGGTTEAALARLKEQHFDSIFLQALEVAKQRSKELNA